jgi:hypothetical protein
VSELKIRHYIGLYSYWHQNRNKIKKIMQLYMLYQNQNQNKIKIFEYSYFFMIVIYSAMATDFTKSMYAYYHQPIGFLIPIVMTIILVLRNGVTFNNKNLLVIIFILAVWTFMQYIKSSQYNTSYSFFMFYNVIIAFIVATVYRFKMFHLYEKIIVQLTIVAILGWLMMIFIPNTLGQIIDVIKLPNSESGILRGNILIFSMTKATTYAKEEVWGLTRNSGFSWEPGRYATMVIIAIFFNMVRTRFQFKKNKEIWILLVGLITTQSTTGFVSLAIIITFLLYNKNIKNAILYLVLLIPLSLAVYNLPFIGEKLDKLSDKSSMEKVDQDLKYNDDGSYVPQRFDGLAFEFMNILNDPILGYGNDPQYSYVKKHISKDLFLSNGLIKVFASYGLFLGAIFFLFLYKSSKVIINSYGLKGGIFFMLLYMSISISYDFTTVPFFLATVMFSQFVEPNFQFNRNYVRTQIT